jgi:hypothetical protein
VHAWQWWVEWCRESGLDPERPTLPALTDAMLDAKLRGWDDTRLAALLEVVGVRGGTWWEPRWTQLYLGLRP